MAWLISSHDFRESFFQIFLPSTTPKESIVFWGNARRVSSNCSGQRTKSMCRAETGKEAANERLSFSPSKYEASIVLREGNCFLTAAYTNLKASFALSLKSNAR